MGKTDVERVTDLEELFDRVRSQFDAETVRGMMGETAADVFGIE